METQHQVMINNWLLEDKLHSNLPVFKKEIIKGLYISMVIGRVHSFQSSSFRETYHKGMVHHWLLEEYIIPTL